MNRIAMSLIVVFVASTSMLAAEGPLDARVTIDFRNAAAADVINLLVQGAGLSAQIGPGTMRPVNLTVTNVKLVNVMNALCDNALCQWRLDGRVVRITPMPSEASAALPERVSLELHDTTATDFFAALAAAIGVQITIEPAFSSEPISLSFKNASTADVLNMLCNLQRCEWDFDPARGLRVTQKK
jgi:type II secretory pathway component GspD/PulD (secretin)